MIRLKAVNIGKWEADADRFNAELNYPLFLRALKGMEEPFHQMEKELFSSQGSSGKHGQWPALSENYRRWKEKHYPGRPIMVLTGQTRDSLTGTTPESIFNTFKSGRKWHIKMGTDVKSDDGFDYPKHHQAKARKKRRTIDPNDQAARKLIWVLQKEIVYASSRSGVWDRATITGNAEFDRNVP